MVAFPGSPETAKGPPSPKRLTDPVVEGLWRTGYRRLWPRFKWKFSPPFFGWILDGPVPCLIDQGVRVLQGQRGPLLILGGIFPSRKRWAPNKHSVRELGVSTTVSRGGSSLETLLILGSWTIRAIRTVSIHVWLLWHVETGPCGILAISTQEGRLKSDYACQVGEM